MWYKNIVGRFFGLAKHACDRRTDRHNYDSQDRASIAASRSKMHIEVTSLECSYDSQAIQLVLTWIIGKVELLFVILSWSCAILKCPDCSLTHSGWFASAHCAQLFTTQVFLHQHSIQTIMRFQCVTKLLCHCLAEDIPVAVVCRKQN